MKIIADTHTHTLACNHAFSTITENAAHAQDIGLDFLFTCEHTKAMPGAAPDIFFESMLYSLPERIYGVYMIRGCEANVVDHDGSLDVGQTLLSRLEWVIASMHSQVYTPVAGRNYTDTWLSVIENPHVDVLGHCGDGRYPFSHEAVVKACARTGKIIEINSHSFKSRPGSPENCRSVALLCKKHGVPVVVSSDAHFWTLIGNFKESLDMLESIDFPQELIINADRSRMVDFLRQKCERSFPFD